MFNNIFSRNILLSFDGYCLLLFNKCSSLHLSADCKNWWPPINKETRSSTGRKKKQRVKRNEETKETWPEKVKIRRVGRNE